jgi:hypothetical protein
MDKAEKNALTIQRDNLKRKLTVINNIERAYTGTSQPMLTTTAHQLSTPRGQDELTIHYETDLNNILNSLTETKAIRQGSIVQETGHHWGSDEVIIVLDETFNEIATKIRREYFEIKDKLQWQEKKENLDTILIYGTSLYWLFSRTLQFIANKLTLIIKIILKIKSLFSSK